MPVFSRDAHSDTLAVAAARKRLYLQLASDAPNRRRKLQNLEELEPWIKGLWTERSSLDHPR
jgi:hypothetical protein